MCIILVCRLNPVEVYLKLARELNLSNLLPSTHCGLTDESSSESQCRIVQVRGFQLSNDDIKDCQYDQPANERDTAVLSVSTRQSKLARGIESLNGKARRKS